MANYQFELSFDGINHSLSPQNGIQPEKLGSLLIALSEALNASKNNLFTLQEIKEGSYSLGFHTNIETLQSEFETIHEKIYSRNLNALNFKQKKYADVLKSIIEKEAYVVSASHSNKKWEVKIKDIEVVTLPTHYFERDSLYGVITRIGGKSLEEQPHIRIDNFSYDIKISSEQEEELKNFYKKIDLKLAFDLRLKRAYEDNKILEAKLLGFSIIGQSKFNENLNKIKSEYGDLFAKFDDSAEIVRQLRNNNDFLQT